VHLAQHRAGPVEFAGEFVPPRSTPIPASRKAGPLPFFYGPVRDAQQAGEFALCHLSLGSAALNRRVSSTRSATRASEGV
jgi:hypothetical protein